MMMTYVEMIFSNSFYGNLTQTHRSRSVATPKETSKRKKKKGQRMISYRLCAHTSHMVEAVENAGGRIDATQRLHLVTSDVSGRGPSPNVHSVVQNGFEPGLSPNALLSIYGFKFGSALVDSIQLLPQNINEWTSCAKLLVNIFKNRLTLAHRLALSRPERLRSCK